MSVSERYEASNNIDKQEFLDDVADAAELMRGLLDKFHAWNEKFESTDNTGLLVVAVRRMVDELGEAPFIMDNILKSMHYEKTSEERQSGRIERLLDETRQARNNIRDEFNKRNIESAASYVAANQNAIKEKNRNIEASNEGSFTATDEVYATLGKLGIDREQQEEMVDYMTVAADWLDDEEDASRK